jgi:ketosteroid isomerase-like protein
MTIKTLLPALALALALAFATSSVHAHGTEKHPEKTMAAGRDTAGAQLHVAPAANDAVAAVERFSAALSSAALDTAAAELDASVLILESGGVERSRDEYLGGHAKHDAEFLKAAHITLKHRTAQASGDLAFVASESEIHAMKGKDMLMIASTETMVLRKSAAGWKIVHIHWSSRRASDGH